MRLVHQLAVLAAVGSILAACSGSKTKYFETEGLMAPPQRCSTEPSRLGVAVRMSRVDDGACEIPNPWLIRAISGVSFTQPATLNCGMASPIESWIQNTVQPAAQRSFGESVTGLEVAASYSCRPRNNRRGAKMSEHGYGNAIDISGFVLESGRKVSVLEDWNGSGDERKFLRQVREEACGPFMTVLGPGSDAHHRDHLHFDLQNRRSGSRYCR
jgi:hypothetical protein